MSLEWQVVRRRAMVGRAAANPFVAMRLIVVNGGGVGALYKGYGLSLMKVRPVTFDQVGGSLIDDVR